MHNQDRSIIFSSQYFGSILFYWALVKSMPVIIEAHENYQKRSVRNRCKILNSNGPLDLSVALKKGKNKQVPIQEVKIAYEDDWATQHLLALEASYGNSAFFDHYKDGIRHILYEKYDSLWQLNKATMNWCINKIGISDEPIESQTYKHDHPFDLRNSQTQAYKELQRHVNEHLVYAQVYEYKFGFVDSLSILDLLFCTGPESYLYLDNIAESMYFESKNKL